MRAVLLMKSADAVASLSTSTTSIVWLSKSSECRR